MPSIDIGCGAGEILYYLAQDCNIQEAIDYSPKLVEIARKRLSSTSIKIYNKDISESYRELRYPIWITAGALNQYVIPSIVTEIVKHFSQNPFTKSFFLFDTIDPSAHRLWQARLYTYSKNRYQPNWKRTVYYLSKLIMESLQKKLWIQLEGPMGYSYRPYFWHQIVNKLNISCEIVSSLFLEYRYHVILRKKHEKREVTRKSI